MSLLQGRDCQGRGGRSAGGLNDPGMRQLIREYLDHLGGVKNYSPHTITAYSNDLSQFNEFLELHGSPAPVDIAGIDRLTVRRFLGDLVEQGKGKRSAARKLSSVRSFLDFLVRKGMLEHNPASGVLSPRLPRRLPLFLSESSVEKMMQLPDRSSVRGLRDRAILEMLYGTGIRLNELIQLDSRSLDLNNDTVKVLGKGSKQRIVPLGRRAKESVKEYLSRRSECPVRPGTSRDAGALFLSDRGRRISARAVYRVVNRYIGLASDIGKKSPHILRHTFATHMVNRGADLRAVKELLGHESLSTTQLYTHVTVDRLKRIYKQAHPKAQ